MLTGDILRLSAERHPSRTALICGEDKISYGDLNQAANRFGNALLQMDIGKGANWSCVGGVCKCVKGSAEQGYIKFGLSEFQYHYYAVDGF